MKRKQAEALQPYLDDLRRSYKKQLRQAGQTRDWPYGYIAALIATYRKLRRTWVAGKRLTRALGGTKQRILLQLVERTTDRETKMRSRWCRVAWLAVVLKVDPDGIVDWIRDGGGLAGRAREAAQLSQELAAR